MQGSQGSEKRCDGCYYSPFMSRSTTFGKAIASLLSNAMLGKSPLAGVGPTPRPYLPCPTQLLRTHRCCCHVASAPSAPAPLAPVTTENRGGEAQTSQTDPQPKAPSGARLRSRRQEAPVRQQSKTDLRKVPGIGPKYEQLLLAKRVGSVESLREVFINQADRKEQQMISYLQVCPPPAAPGLLACMVKNFVHPFICAIV